MGFAKTLGVETVTMEAPRISNTPARSVSLELDSPELAATYDRVSTRQFDHGKVLIAALAAKPGSKVLDVGCGTGRLGDYVANLLGPDSQVHGVDPLPLRIEIAARKNRRFSATVGRAEDLSQFAEAEFDALYANSVLHWVEDKPRALREFFRVLKPGGRIALNSADAERAHQSATLVREAVLEEGLNEAAAASGFGTNHRITRAQLGTLLHAAGFIEVEVEPQRFVDEVSDVDDLIAWSTSSSFGNFLSDLDAAQRARVRARLAHKLEALRSGAALKLERYLVFATATKP
ncbi:MAG: Ubiquinone/menaquinone biosynthesis C-methyltransferase UbiE [Myxococcaceae bacterium]|nr:Ubiquinone/menaquinone biosynthesis C-methyltransferase UbiE [Myxococcaceae bacterium]